MTSKLQEDAQFRALRLLEDNPEMSQRALAQAAGISVGGTRCVLSALIEKSLVKIGNFTAARDKRRYAYILTPRGIAQKAAMTKRFLVRKMDEYEALRCEIEELRRGLDENANSQEAGLTGKHLSLIHI